MKLVIGALSAVLLSGCSWMSMGNQGYSSYGSSGAYGSNCGPNFGGNASEALTPMSVLDINLA